MGELALGNESYPLFIGRRRDAVAGPRKLLDHVAAESRRPQQQRRVPAAAETCAGSRVNVGL